MQNREISNRHDLKLDLDCLVQVARAETGLTRYNSPGFLDRAKLIVDAYKKVGMDAKGELIAAESILDVMVTHLQLIDDFSKYPDIEKEEIKNPVIVGGFPRSGTTLLYSLLAADPQARSPHWWEVFHPSPPIGLSPEYDGLRRQISQREMAEYIQTCPGIKPAHNFFVNGADMILESYMAWSLDLRSLSPFLFFRPPASPTPDPYAGSINLAGDMQETYQFEKKLLQHLQWKRPKRHWVLKDPTHHFHLPQLLKVFPDCTFIWPHRDPVPVFASVVELASIMTGAIARKDLDRREMAQNMLAMLTAGLNSVIDLPVVDAPNVVHVNYQDLVRDGTGLVKSIYEKIGRPFSAEAQANIAAYQANPKNRADYYGKFQYKLENTGLTADDVRKAFGNYIKRFDIPAD